MNIQDRVRAGVEDLKRMLYERNTRIAEQEAELATLRAENAHLKRALELVDALRNKERNLPL